MKDIIYSTEVSVISNYKTDSEKKKSVLHSNEITVRFSDNIDDDKYYTEDNYLNKDGIEVAKLALCQGLIGLVHDAHQRGIKDSAKMFRECIAEMERLFVETPDIFMEVLDKSKKK